MHLEAANLEDAYNQRLEFEICNFMLHFRPELIQKDT